MQRFVLVLCAVTTALVTAPPARAEMYRLAAPDGTVHFTNAPTDPRYQRLGLGSGTAAGWLRLPEGATSRYAREIREVASRHGVPEKLVAAVIRAESSFNPHAVSPKGAQGLMQLMPATASMLGVHDSFDPRQNIEGGVRHLRGLIDRFGNNLPLALAAYNAGERAVSTHRGIPPYTETREYVERVLRFYDGGAGIVARTVVYRRVEDDGTVPYTNIPPRGRH
ncbi:MAG: hypothetical protein A3D33_05195 [Candidatus Rokubacteria bacterium RIFCSPHIGHO2_02_FULL_73_26]|nr:MAG: hypothetical protein A3D33_05195 [Candidatus Rokubacteria bacterium RIFCSPHIGHO2_02_FULL_73_26]